MAEEVLSDEQVQARLGDSAWEREGNQIVRELKFEDFVAAIAFVDRVAACAQAHNHHPDILVHGYNRVTLTLTNHAAGGLTAIDFEMAERFDALSGA